MFLDKDWLILSIVRHGLPRNTFAAPNCSHSSIIAFSKFGRPVMGILLIYKRNNHCYNLPDPFCEESTRELLQSIEKDRAHEEEIGNSKSSQGQKVVPSTHQDSLCLDSANSRRLSHRRQRSNEFLYLWSSPGAHLGRDGLDTRPGYTDVSPDVCRLLHLSPHQRLVN